MQLAPCMRVWVLKFPVFYISLFVSHPQRSKLSLMMNLYEPGGIYMKIECVVDSKSKVGEGALWDPKAHCLWWVDIPVGKIYRYTPEAGTNEVFDFGEPVGCLAVRASGGLVLAVKTGFYFYDPETGTRQAISDPEADLPANRFNDGGPDRQGRFWGGTMHEGPPPTKSGSFYRLDPDGSVTKSMTGFYTTNGMAFSPDGRLMYVSDSNKDVRTIWVHDYNIATGTPSNRRVFFDTRKVAGRPDGGTVDAEGFYWMAGIDGWQLLRISPDGKVDRTVEMPIERPSKPMFGGRDLDTIFVTSLGVGLKEGSVQPQAGGLFSVTGLGIKGVKEAHFKG